MNYKNKINILLLFMLTVLTLFGTTSCLKKKPKGPKNGSLEISSNVPGATIYINGKKITRKTPLAPSPIPPGYYLLKFDKEGYNPVWKQVHIQKGRKTQIRVSLKPITSSVIIKSTPAGKVTYNGDVIGATPVPLNDLPLGKHSVTITQLGYTPKTVSFSVTSERPQLVRVNLDSNMGHLSLTSTVENANLTIDGEKRGSLPFEGEIQQGQHTVKVEKEGYATLEEVLTVRKGETTTRSFNLQLLPGELSVTTEPKADISINGKPYGLTPLHLKDLPPGEYTIKVIHDGFDPYQLKAHIAPGQHLKKEIKLSSNTGGIDVVVYPAGVTIYLDGKKVGVSKAMPDNKKLTEVFKIRNIAAGRHLLTFAHKLARPEMKKVHVTVRKREIKRLKRCSMWVPDHILRLKDDPRPAKGILISETKKSIIFSAEPGITQEFDRSLILSLKPIKREE